MAWCSKMAWMGVVSRGSARGVVRRISNNKIWDEPNYNCKHQYNKIHGYRDKKYKIFLHKIQSTFKQLRIIVLTLVEVFRLIVEIKLSVGTLIVFLVYLTDVNLRIPPRGTFFSTGRQNSVKYILRSIVILIAI